MTNLSGITDLHEMAMNMAYSSPAPAPSSIADLHNMTSPNSSPAPSSTTSPSTPSQTHVVNYGDLYKSPKNMGMSSQYLIGDYGHALVTGNTPVYKNPPHVLPGNRYFLNTHTKCKDASNNIQDRSIVIDNVLETLVDDTNDDNNKGLMYSFLASLESLDKNPYPTTPTYAPTAYLKDVSGQSDLPLCVPVSVYLDGTNTNTSKGWITDNDKINLDPVAIKEGFQTTTIEPMTAEYLGPSLRKSLNSYKESSNSKNSALSSSVNQVNSSNTSKLKSANVKNVQTFKQQNANSSNLVLSQQKASTASESNSQTVGSPRLQQTYRKPFETKYSKDNIPILKLFELFLDYKSPTETIPTNKKPTFGEQVASKPKQISGDCYALIFEKFPIPKNIPNTFTSDNQCPDTTYGDLQIGDFLSDLKSQAIKAKGKPYVSLNLPRQYIPKTTVCEMEKVPIGNGSLGFNIIRKSVSYKNNVDAFSYYLEQYRPYIISAFLALDYPSVFPACEPSKEKKKTEGFTPMQVYHKSHITYGHVGIVLLIIIVILYCVVLVRRM